MRRQYWKWVLTIAVLVSLVVGYLCGYNDAEAKHAQEAGYFVAR